MNLFVFGSTGDLVKRKVMKALQELGGDFMIYAVGRRGMDKREYQKFICSEWCKLDFRNRLDYLQADLSSLNPKDFESKLDENSVNYFYLSLPPKLVDDVLGFLSEIKKKGYDIKILSEKPFGESLDSAIGMKKKIYELKLGKDFFISDHYLFKKSFSNLPKEFDSVKIVSVEEVGLEGRVSYYDSVGAIRDMIQSHFLNLVVKNMAFNFDFNNLVVDEVSKGQYEGYVEELGEESETETCVDVKFDCCGKDFEFVTAKAFGNKESFIEIDEERFEDVGENSYVELFRSFFNGETGKFPTIEDSILAWRIVEEIEDNFTGELEMYEKGKRLQFK